LILASRSPQRESLLRDAGFTFSVEPADIDEDSHDPKIMPIKLALDLAEAKANALASRFPERVILGADTVVAFGDHIVGKPEDPAHAREILRLISGATVIVVTGISVLHLAASFGKTTRVMSAVRIKSLTDLELEKYMLSGAWRNKAGAFGLQDENTIVQDVRGCRTNVIGLPMTTTTRLLAEAGVVPNASR
jgi:septum formation protein